MYAGQSESIVHALVPASAQAEGDDRVRRSCVLHTCHLGRPYCRFVSLFARVALVVRGMLLLCVASLLLGTVLLLFVPSLLRFVASLLLFIASLLLFAMSLLIPVVSLLLPVASPPGRAVETSFPNEVELSKVLHSCSLVPSQGPAS